MLYGGKPQKLVAPPKRGCPRVIECRGPGPYTYAFQAKQPGSNYKIRLRDSERVRKENIGASNRGYVNNIVKQIQHQELIDLTDRKHVYNRIKRAVECEMKANAHLFEEKRPEPERMVEDEPEQQPKITKEDLEEKAREMKIIREEKQRKIVEEKRLQQIYLNSVELRSADIVKRGRDISKCNYKIIQENEEADKERKIKKIELANLENLELFKKQSLLREEEKQKSLEKKHKFRKELHVQMHQLEEMKNQQKVLKNIESDKLRELMEQLNEEKKLEQLEYAKSKMQTIEDVKLYVDEKMKLFSIMNKKSELLDKSLLITMSRSVKDENAEKIDKKTRFRLETEKYLQQQLEIKEQQKKENEEKLNKVIKEIKEINELEQSVERRRAEMRRKRIEEENRAISEQLKFRETLLEEQKDAKRKLREQLVKEHEEYLKEKNQLCEDKKRLQSQLRKDLRDQIHLNEKKHKF